MLNNYTTCGASFCLKILIHQYLQLLEYENNFSGFIKSTH